MRVKREGAIIMSSKAMFSRLKETFKQSLIYFKQGPCSAWWAPV